MSEQRTPEERHELIAEKIEGWQRLGRRLRNPDMNPDPPLHVRDDEWYQETWIVHDYSASLDLCHRAEMKIADMGKQERYVEELFLVVNPPHSEEWLAAFMNSEPDAYQDFFIATAPASARVEAMCRLIDSMEGK